MPQKLLYLDLETTGLDVDICGTTQIAGIIEIDGQIKMSFDFRVRPFPADVIDVEALTVTGKTIAEIRAYKDPLVIYKNLVAILGRFIDRYDKNDKFTMVGYRCDFDDKFLRKWFNAVHAMHPELGPNAYYGSWIAGYRLDVMQLALMCKHFQIAGIDKLPNLKQPTLAQAIGFSYNPHDAIEDVRACRAIYHYLTDKMRLMKDTTNDEKAVPEGHDLQLPYRAV